MHNKANTPSQDLRDPRLITALSVLLFLNGAYQLYIFMKFLHMTQISVSEMPTLVRILFSYPGLNIVLLCSLMATTLYCAWKSQKAYLIACASLFLQGLLVMLIAHALQSTYFQLMMVMNQ